MIKILVATACFSWADQVAEMDKNFDEFGPFASKMVGEYSVTIRNGVGYVAKFPGGCFGGQIMTIDPAEIDHLFTPSELGALVGKRA